MNRAALDLGSQSALLTVIAPTGEVLLDEARIVRLGEGLGPRGMLKPERMDAALAVLREYAAAAAGLGVSPDRVRAVATSAARRALNARTFLDRVKEETGLTLEIISGQEEARLTWRGAIQGIELPDGPSLVIDLGGGSTELILRDSQQVFAQVSLEIGAVRLTEAHLGTGPVDHRRLARLREEIAAALAGLSLPVRPRLALGVGGTATTLAAMDAGLTDYDAAALHGYNLTRLAIRRWIDALLPAPPAERAALCAVDPGRADYMLAGAAVLEGTLEAAGKQSMRVSTRGLRFGLLLE
jgi:exopolyphosphatase/guanosine-5'-triphosphate,3'-diphosphate pyrophosphatase